MPTLIENLQNLTFSFHPEQPILKIGHPLISMTMKDLKDKNYYERLGLSSSASTEEIKAAYHDFARVFHPDSHFFDDLLAEAQLSQAQTDDKTLKLLTEAYNTLISEDKRKKYDHSLANNRTNFTTPGIKTEKIKEQEQKERKIRQASRIWEQSDCYISEPIASTKEKEVRIESVAEMIQRQRAEAQSSKKIELRVPTKKIVIASSTAALILSAIVLVVMILR